MNFMNFINNKNKDFFSVIMETGIGLGNRLVTKNRTNNMDKSCKHWKYSASIGLTCTIGLILSTYAFYVELSVEHNSNYEAMCDINEHISCTKVFSSKYGRGFGIIGELFGEDSVLNQPNSLTGIFFYLLMVVLSGSENLRIVKFEVILTALSNLMSIYLAYLLYFVLADLCIVCVATYIINLILFVLVYNRYSYLKREFDAVKHKDLRKID